MPTLHVWEAENHAQALDRAELANILQNDSLLQDFLPPQLCLSSGRQKLVPSVVSTAWFSKHRSWRSSISPGKLLKNTEAIYNSGCNWFRTSFAPSEDNKSLSYFTLKRIVHSYFFFCLSKVSELRGRTRPFAKRTKASATVYYLPTWKIISNSVSKRWQWRFSVLWFLPALFSLLLRHSPVLSLESPRQCTTEVWFPSSTIITVKQNLSLLFCGFFFGPRKRKKKLNASCRIWWFEERLRQGIRRNSRLHCTWTGYHCAMWL